MIGAHLAGVEALREEFGFRAWGPLALDGLHGDDVDALLERDCVGVSLPAGAFDPPSSIDSLRSVLARLEQLDVPLFIHPGPGRGATPRECSLADPLWWPALTRYVAQMQAAWLAFSALARCPPATAGGLRDARGRGAAAQRAPWRARGPAVDVRDPHSFYDTSSYGPVAIEAMAAASAGSNCSTAPIAR